MTDLENQIKLTGRLVPVAEISNQRREQMFSLMHNYYENITRSTFFADLDAKDWVIVIFDETSQQVVGFSTQVMMELKLKERTIRALFSGDTIVDSRQRGQKKLFHISGWLLQRLMEKYPDDELYWFLISKGYKTYRFLPLFFSEFYPAVNQSIPPDVAEVIDGLATSLAGSRYDPDRKVIKAEQGGCFLRSGVADVTEERLRDKHIQFFVEANPGHAQGDELCCVAPVKRENFTRLAHRNMGPEPPADVVRV